MSLVNYNKCMEYLDIIEKELDKVAEIVGHCSYKEFMLQQGDYTGP